MLRKEDSGPNFSKIGQKLVSAAAEAEKSAGAMLGELFPYVFEASRRMSTRAISTWLKENYGIQISQPTISRALRRPEFHWRAYAEHLEPFARIVADAGQTTIEAVLADDLAVFDEWVRHHLTPSIAGETEDELRSGIGQLNDALKQLRVKWFGLSGEMRSHIRCHLGGESELLKGDI